MEAKEPPAGGSRALSSPRKEKIYLNILSPSSEVPQKLTYPDISTSMSIIELKHKIQNDVETRPSPERQRLIYRGRALVQEDKTLEDVFGYEAINASDVFSLHLVLPPIPNNSSTGTISSQMRQNTPINAYSGGLGSLPSFQSQSTSVPQRPASTGQLPGSTAARHTLPGMHNEVLGALHHPPLAPGQNVVFNQRPMVPPMQDLFNAHLAALGQPIGAQAAPGSSMPNVGVPHGHHTGGWPHQPTFPHFPMFPQPNFQHILAHQQQARAAAGQQGLGSGDQTQMLNQDTPPSMQQEQHPGASHGQPTVTTDPAASNTIIREGQAPNGGQWRVVINQSTTTMNSQPGMGANTHVSMQQPGSYPINNQGTQLPNLPSGPVGQAPLVTGSNVGRPSYVPTPNRDNYLFWSTNDPALLYGRLLHLERALDYGNTPTENDILQARAQLNDLSSRGLLGNTEIALTTRLNNLSLRASQLRGAQGATNFAVGGNRFASSTTTAISTTNTMVYLLSSANGQHALLVSPSGMYNTPGLGVSMLNPDNPILPQIPLSAAVAQPQPVILRPNDQVNPANREAHHNELPAQQDQVRDLVRVLLPLGGHLWLLVRLFGFVYFFTPGAGWYRTILLGVCALAVFIAQTGVLRPLQQVIWDPLRRHVEALVPLGGNNGLGGPAQPNGQGNTAAQLTPRQLADRLLQGRNGEGSFMRRNVRRVERAMALFIASLVPRVGERYIAARDAVEAVRQAAVREREEQQRREEESRQQSVQDTTGVEEENFADAEEGIMHRRDQQPLVEI